MVLAFNDTLSKVLPTIGIFHYHSFPIHEAEHSETFITQYGTAKESVVGLLNQRYQNDRNHLLRQSEKR